MTEIQIVYEGPIVKREDARANGQNRYFSGVPCRHGHLTQRNVSKGDCLSCVSVANKKQYDRPGIKEKRKKYASQWYQENKEYVSEKSKKWMVDNYGSVSAYQSHQYYKHQDTRKLGVKRTALKYPLRKKANDVTRKARQRGAEGKFGRDDIEKMLLRQGNKCVYCKADITGNYHVDHIMPLILGGSNWPSNLQCLCPTCNMRKKAKHPDDWHREIGYSG